jgi:alkylation response protein AidB-like acyl-CoA dehydrogenase
MDFRANEDQRALQRAVHDWCARRLPAPFLRDVLDAGSWNSRLWEDLHALGILTLRAGPGNGGLALGLADAALAFEELGAALVPGPLIATHLAVTHLPNIVGDPAPLVTAADACRTPMLVPHLTPCNSVILVGERDLVSMPAADLTGEVLRHPLDPGTPLHAVEAPTGGTPVGGPEQMATWRREAAVLTGAFQVGIATAVLDKTGRYVGDREQFGRPVGAQQAVKHRLADMLVRVRLARAAVLAAAVTCDDPSIDDPDRVSWGAKLLADDAAVQNARAAVQLHGGMGFTWEVDVHLYLKRAWVQAQQWGTADELAGKLAATH